MKQLILAGFLFVLKPLASQIAKEVPPLDFIKTITFKSNTTQGQLPILKLGEPIILEFDALNANEEDFYYVIEHFNYDWTPSSLTKGEYLQGIDNQRIIDYFNSFNTFQIYSHYKLSIPNIQTRGLLKSGNYMISIFEQNNEIMFSRKFMVYEELVNVNVQIKRSREVQNVAEMQTVDLAINTNQFNFNNPLETVKTIIIQNNNLNTAITGIKPQYTLGNQLIYKYPNKTAFWGGNEYLFFETKNIRAAGLGVQFIDLKDIYHSYLFTNLPRRNAPYTFNPDINGNFQISALDRSNTDIEADYSVVHFSLAIPQIEGAEVHVYGNFNAFTIEPLTKMTYNREAKKYETAIRLKQGFYNYKYVVVNKADNSIVEGGICGNFWQTENNYKVLVYYTDLGARYDRIIGYGENSSINITN